jgi:hypothetical protein
MIELIPYFGGFVTLLFGFAFYVGLQQVRKSVDEDVNE